MPAVLNNGVVLLFSVAVEYKGSKVNMSTMKTSRDMKTIGGNVFTEGY